MVLKGLIAGTIIIWAKAISECGTIIFFAGVIKGKTTVMPLGIFANMQVGKVEAAVFLSLVSVVIALVSLYAFKKLGGKGYLW